MPQMKCLAKTMQKNRYSVQPATEDKEIKLLYKIQSNNNSSLGRGKQRYVSSASAVVHTGVEACITCPT